MLIQLSTVGLTIRFYHIFFEQHTFTFAPVNEVNKFHIHAPETSLVRYNYKLLKLMPLSIIYVLQCKRTNKLYYYFLISHTRSFCYFSFNTHTQKVGIWVVARLKYVQYCFFTFLTHFNSFMKKVLLNKQNPLIWGCIVAWSIIILWQVCVHRHMT